MSRVIMHCDEGERCLERQSDGQSGREVAVQRSWIRSKPVASALSAVAATLLLGAGVLLRSSAEQQQQQQQQQQEQPRTHAAPSDTTLWSAQVNCEAYFERGGNCSIPSSFQCDISKYDGGYFRKEDEDKSFECCCNRWPDQDYLTGMIALAEPDHPRFCLDIPMPYNKPNQPGRPWNSGPLRKSSCYFSNPNKYWHFDRSGKGPIRWTSHKDQCLQVTAPYVSLGRGSCANFDYGPPEEAHKLHPIKFLTKPPLCLDVEGLKQEGGMPTVQPCDEGKSSQQFETLTFSAPKNKQLPSLFCIAVMLPGKYDNNLHKWQGSYEKGLLKWQHDQDDGKGIGIFTCDEFAVYSNESIVVLEKTDTTKEVKTTRFEGTMFCKMGGHWKTALNTDVFKRFWKAVLKDPRTLRNEWTIKVDPDCVFFPDRLREMLRSRWPGGIAGCRGVTACQSTPVYINNCYLGMHGPIEVVSQGALKLYNKSSEKCEKGDDKIVDMQEDVYIRNCWELIGVQRLEAYNLLMEDWGACKELPVTLDGRHPCFSHQVAFHPFKTPEGFNECYRRANSSHWLTQMVPYNYPPGASSSEGEWEVKKGDPCVVDSSSGCVTSPNFPDKYGAKEKCTIRLRGVLGTMVAVHFDTESYDKLTINGRDYSGKERPNGIKPTGEITWSSDSGGNKKGWQICPKRALVQFARVWKGNCRIIGGCVCSPNYPENYGNNEACTIGVAGAVGTIKAVDFKTGPDDTLKFNGHTYSGHFVRESTPTTEIFWSSSSGPTKKGWRLCPVHYDFQKEELEPIMPDMSGEDDDDEQEESRRRRRRSEDDDDNDEESRRRRYSRRRRSEDKDAAHENQRFWLLVLPVPLLIRVL